MKVWEVAEHDHMVRFFWFATKKEAIAHKRKALLESPDANIVISTTEFPATRQGIVDAMNWVITLTCFNEG